MTTAFTPRRPTPRRRFLAIPALITWTLCLAAAAWVLTSLAGRLPAPPVAHPGRLSLWLAHDDPPTALFGLLRVGGLWLTWYLAAATALGLLARASRLPAAVRAADRLTVAPLRRVLHVSLGASLAITTLAPAALPAAAQPFAAQPDDGPPILRRLSSSPDPNPAPTPYPPPAPPPSPPAPPSPTWTVARGQSFWSIARQVLARHRGRAPTAADIAPYWRAMVAANLDRLARPGHPDLLFAGQVLVVPPPPDVPP